MTITIAGVELAHQSLDVLRDGAEIRYTGTVRILLLHIVEGVAQPIPAEDQAYLADRGGVVLAAEEHWPVPLGPDGLGPDLATIEQVYTDWVAAMIAAAETAYVGRHYTVGLQEGTP